MLVLLAHARGELYTTPTPPTKRNRRVHPLSIPHEILWPLCAKAAITPNDSLKEPLGKWTTWHCF